MKSFVLIFSLLLSTFLHAANVQIPLNAVLEPANDLVYKGEEIDKDEAYELLKEGVKLWELNPKESIIWEDKKHTSAKRRPDLFPAQKTTVYYNSTLFDLSSAKGLFRASVNGDVKGKTKAFTLTASLDNHGALMRAVLLRKLGYKVNPPEYYKTLKVSFERAEIDEENVATHESTFLEDEENPDWYLIRFKLMDPPTKDESEADEDEDDDSNEPKMTLAERIKLAREELEKRTLAERVQLAKLYLRDRFLDKVSDYTLTSRKRWIHQYPDNHAWVVLQDVVLEQGRVTVQQLHWGLLTSDMTHEKRVFRALIFPYVLADYRERVNTFAWEPGSIFNNHISLDHLMADAFGKATIDDVKWISARLGKLTKADMHEIAMAGKFPRDITMLMSEKLASRRNRLLQLVSLDSEFGNLPVNFQITVGNVVKGKLKDTDYQGYAPDFVEPDPKRPLRFTEIFRYLLMEGVGTGMSYAMDKLNEYIPSYAISDLAENRAEELQRDLRNHINKHGPGVPWEQPTGLKGIWGGPTASLKFSANRSVVTGTYFGSSAKVQLVDQVGVSASVGMFLTYSAFDDVLPSLSANLAVTRNYVHVKPVGSLKQALKTDWTSILVAEFMPRLGRILKSDVKCSLPDSEVWVTDSEVDGKTYKKVSYDNLESRDGATPADKKRIKEAAEKKRKSLVDQLGDDAVLPGIHAVDRTKECETEVDTGLNANIKQFTDRLEPGEMFVIADGIASNANAQIVIPLTELLGAPSAAAASIRINGGVSYSMIRRTTIYKTEEGKIQVYLQNLNHKIFDIGFDVNFYIQLLSARVEYHRAKGKTQFFQLPLGDDDAITPKRNAMRSLKHLLKWNSAEVLRDHFNPWTIKHKIKQKIARFTLFWKHWDFLRQGHTVDIYPPYDPLGRWDRNQKRRRLYLYKRVNRSGNNYYGFFAKALRFTTNEYGPGPIGPVTRPGENPAHTPFGNAKWTSVTVEAEITPGKEFKPVAITEQVFAGWKMRKRKLMKVLDKLEAEIKEFNLSRKVINRSVFNSAKALELYDIRSTLILYPGALNKLKEFMTHHDRKVYFRLKKQYAGRRTSCKNFTFKGRNVQRDRVRKTLCVPEFMYKLLKVRKGLQREYRRMAGFASPKQVVEWLSKVVHKLERKIHLPRLLDWFGRDNFLFVLRVAGFRTNDETGATEYLSDTVGEFDNDLGAGVFKDVANQTGIQPFELYATYFNPGF